MQQSTLRVLQSALLSLLFLTAFAFQAQTPNSHSANGISATDEELKFAVIVTRHGVRSPTGKAEQLNQYSRQPWPEWSVPPGYLTEHGAKLMTLFGVYERELLSSEGLLTPSGCADAEHIRIVADSDQRTRETGKALAAGLAPGCDVELHALPEGTNDPLFHHSLANVTEADKVLATAAVSGRISGNLKGLPEVYRRQIDELEEILTACNPEPACLSTTHTPNALLDLPSSLTPGKSEHLVELRSPLSTAGSLTESLMLEYAEGMDAANVGWGRVDRRNVNELLELHAASAEISQRTPFIARAQSSYLLLHIMESMQQTTSTEPITGALSKSNDRLLILVGHDTNIATISGALDLHWLIDGRRDDTPPGGALIFELWRNRVTSESSVRVFYTAQTLDQMRNSTPLHLSSPPERAALFLPGCSRADNSCTWESFQKTVLDSINTKFVK